MSGYDVKEVDFNVKEDIVYDTDSTGPSPFGLKPSQIRAKKSYYGLRVATGKMKSPETHISSLYACLIGNMGATGKICLSGLGGVNTCTHQDMILETLETLGEIQVVAIGIDRAPTDIALFVEYTSVCDFGSRNNLQEVTFPCYHWIKKNQMLTTTSKSTTRKAVQDNAILIKEREDQLEMRRRQYQWQMFPDVGLPSGVKNEDLPEDEEFSRVENVHFTMNGLKDALATALAKFTTSLDNLDSYIDLFKCLDPSPLSVQREELLKSDVEFGRQMMNGVNPTIIQKCDVIPSNFAVTDDLVQPFLTRGKTLTEEMKDGNVFICDMKIMDGLPTREGQFCAAPICLLYVNSENELVPIAIQLKQEKDEENLVFLPNAYDWIDWWMAKIYYQSAHAQYHQLVTHYMSCHATMEAYAVATMRNLPDAHPINKLLRPHFRYTMAINSRARAALINTGGIIDRIFAINTEGKEELWRRVTKEWSVDWTNIEKYVKERGVEDLPGYHYRDDGVKIFKAIKQYASDVVDVFYDSDEDVKADIEIQAWAQDIVSNGFPGFFDSKPGRGFPSEITTKDELVERCTVIIFTGSAQHASVNFGQYSLYGYIPNAPCTMCSPPPVVKRETDIQKLVNTLPKEETAKESITMVYLLSQYSKDEVYLGQFPYKRFTESQVQSDMESLQTRLEALSGSIRVRNENLDFPYTFMDPAKIPNSIA